MSRLIKPLTASREAKTTPTWFTSVKNLISSAVCSETKKIYFLYTGTVGISKTRNRSAQENFANVS